MPEPTSEAGAYNPADPKDARFCTCGAERGHHGWERSCKRARVQSLCPDCDGHETNEYGETCPTCVSETPSDARVSSPRLLINVERVGDFLSVKFTRTAAAPVTLSFDRKNAQDVIDAMQSVLRAMSDAPWIVEDSDA